MKSKRCRRCGASKALALYASDKKNRDGKRNRCRECVTALAREAYLKYYSANRNEMLVKGRAYYMMHRDECQARIRQYASRRPEAHVKARRRWFEKHREDIKETQRNACASLTDPYVARVLRRQAQTAGEIADELIGAKRAQLKLHRQLKELNRAIQARS